MVNTRTCENCGSDIAHKQASARFCSKACYRVVYKQINAEKLRSYARERQKALRDADPSKYNAKQREWKQNNKDKIRAYRRLAAEKQGKAYCAKPTPTEGQIDRAAKDNALQAWKYWMTEKAPTWWLDCYWQSTGEPWKDPRLNEAGRYRVRYANDTDFMLAERLRRQETKKRKRDGISELIRGAIRRDAESRTIEIRLGYSIAELRQHLERQFTRGMSWEKFKDGDIHIDHIIPQASFDLSDDDQWRKCWCLSNLRPLWARDNLAKSGKVLTLC
jgi:hypothetical protein